MATSKPSGLPQQIPDQNVPLCAQDINGQMIVDINWYLFLYNIWKQVLGATPGSIPFSPGDTIALADIDVNGADIPQAYRQIANLGLLLPDPQDALPTYRDLANAFILAQDALLQDPSSDGGGGTAGTLDFTTDGTLSADSDALLPTEKAVKTYADTAIAAAIAGLSWKEEVRAATTVTGVLATAYIVGAVVDGVTLALGDRILLKNQSGGTANGIYTVNLIGAPTRSTDANTGPELVSAACSVSEGTANADTAWTCTTIAPIVIGTTPLVWAAAPAGTITALNGDVTASGTGNVAATLATVNSNVGSFTLASVTVNAKGLVTAASDGAPVGGGVDPAIFWMSI